VCSAQTLEKRKSFPGLDLLIIDEAHQTRKATKKFIDMHPNIKVIGLSATPFTAGLGNIFSHVVNTVTTKYLVDTKMLVPLRVFLAKEIDMTGAKKIAGEWSDDETSERGIKITGDVVNEWIKKTHEVYGRPRKTIVFAASVAHGADLASKFNEAGYNFVPISYMDTDEYKKEVFEDFAKPDTGIHGLIAVDILTKGFDVPDVQIGVSARPFSKSLSSHIQQMGRVMRSHPSKEFGLWLCLAKGSKVLTDSGLVPIDKVTLSHKIWDGTNFVNHGGAVCNGIQKVITYQGLTATEGHLVHTQEGWRTFGDCARKQIRITQTGLGGTPIRIGEDLRSKCFLVGLTAQKIYSRFMRMCDLWIQKLNFIEQFAKWKNKRLSCMQSARASISNVAIQPSASNESKMLFPYGQSIPHVWRGGCRVPIYWSKARSFVDYGAFGDTGLQYQSRAITYTVGQDKPVWTLRIGKSEMDFCGTQSIKQEGESGCGKNAQIQNKPSRNTILGQYFEAVLLGWNDGRANNREIHAALNQTEREVWDILDAGQHNRFTCEGLLVHNCHSGNFLRFREDWDEIYENGASELDDGREKPKKEPTMNEKEAAKCPRCGGLWGNNNICSHCGFVRQRRNEVIDQPGELVELEGKSVTKMDKQEFYSELLFMSDARGYKEGWAAWKFKEKFGVFPRSLEKVQRPVSLKTLNWLKSKAIAYSKGR
jgi:ribosomal protein L32